LTAGLGGGVEKAHTQCNPLTTTKPKQPLDSKCRQSTTTAKMIAATADVTRAKGKKDITTGAA
jgi:hypothetical protein